MADVGDFDHNITPTLPSRPSRSPERRPRARNPEERQPRRERRHPPPDDGQPHIDEFV
jgi:hypothetical protein